MKDAGNRFVIAYLAPETLSPWVTFVYEELFELEWRGLSVIPMSLRWPSQAARGQEALVERTLIVYAGLKPGLLAQGLVGAAQLFGFGAWKALCWLAAATSQSNKINQDKM
jgi:hypothetical protein